MAESPREQMEPDVDRKYGGSLAQSLVAGFNIGQQYL